MYSHPRAIDAQRRLFGQPRRSRRLMFWFWAAYAVFIASVISAGAFFWGVRNMQPWDAVQVQNEENPNNGRAGIVTAINRESGQVVVRLDATTDLPIVEIAADVSELKRL